MNISEAETCLGFKIEDAWFLEHHMDALTEEFCHWWMQFYLTPQKYVEQDEYYVRMAFALMGWNAARNW